MTEQTQKTQTMNTEFYQPERVLVIVAHADDIEFGMAGTVARWTAAGAQVTYCIVTDNSSGSNDPNTEKEALIITRKTEQVAAAAVVGVFDVRFLDYPDGVLQASMELRRDLTRVIRQVRPQVVMTFDPTTVMIESDNYINHPDHRAASEAALYATFPSAETRPIFPELLAEGHEPHKVHKLYMTLSTQDNTIVDITETMPHKLAALRCHASQVGEDDFEMLKKWNAEAGAPYGMTYAETFRVMTLHEPQQTQ